MSVERAGAWSGVWWLSARWLRRRWPGMVPLLLIVATGTAGASIALSTADRTAGAYDEYLRRAGVGDVVINPSVSTREVDEVIRTLPGVERVTSDTVFIASLDDGAPRTRREGANAAFQGFVHGSTDGRYRDMDRPVVRSGRMPAARNEAVVSVDMARSQGLGIGDRVPLSFWQPGLPDAQVGTAFDAAADELIEPIGVETVEIVGTVILPGQALPDELLPRADMILSPELADRYDCLPPMPSPGSTFVEAIATLIPADCALAYRYYSLSFGSGTAGVKPALEEFITRSGALNGILADISDLDEVGAEAPQHFLIATEQVLESQRVDRAIWPVVAALVVVGVAVSFVTLVLVALAVVRELRQTGKERAQWRELAVGRAGRAVVVGLPAAVAVGFGAIVGAVAGYLLGPGPIGQVRVLEPAAAGRFDVIAAATAVALAIVGIGIVAMLAARSTDRMSAPLAGPSMTRAARAIPATIGSPAIAEGVRAAIGPRAALPAVASSALIAGVLVAAVVFASSMSQLVSTPRSYGWPWDVAAMTGFGYGDLDLEGAHRLLDGDRDVASWAALGFLNDIALDDEPMMALLALDGTSELDLTLLSGSIPDRPDEVAVGAETAADRGLEIGDTVELSGAFPTTATTISGIVVFPPIGPFAADRVGAGTGLLLPRALVSDLAAQSGGEDPSGLAAFVGVEFADGAPIESIDRVGEQLGPLDTSGTPGVTYEASVRPPELVEARAARTVPVLVAVVLAVMATVGLLFASWASVRARRRDLAVMRSLGFTAGQVRRSVWTQSVTTAALAIVVGVPLGVIAGRVLWRAFAGQLGVVPDPAGAWFALGCVVAGGLVVAVLVAQLPAVLATRHRPADGLRVE